MVRVVSNCNIWETKRETPFMDIDTMFELQYDINDARQKSNNTCRYRLIIILRGGSFPHLSIRSGTQSSRAYLEVLGSRHGAARRGQEHGHRRPHPLLLRNHRDSPPLTTLLFLFDSFSLLAMLLFHSERPSFRPSVWPLARSGSSAVRGRGPTEDGRADDDEGARPRPSPPLAGCWRRAGRHGPRAMPVRLEKGASEWTAAVEEEKRSRSSRRRPDRSMTARKREKSEMPSRSLARRSLKLFSPHSDRLLVPIPSLSHCKRGPPPLKALFVPPLAISAAPEPRNCN